MIIALESINCGGKTTIGSKLCDRLNKMGICSIVIKAPDYDGLYGNDISKYLKGELPIENGKIDELFKSNRMYIQKTAIEPALKKYQIVLLDRFSLSGQVYSILRGTSIDNHQYLQQLVFGEISPDITLFIDCDIEIAYKRYLDRQQFQIHTQSQQFLEQTRDIFIKMLQNVNHTIITNNDAIEQSVNSALNIILSTQDSTKNIFI